MGATAGRLISAATVTTRAGPPPAAVGSGAATGADLAGLASRLGGRFSTELGIHVDSGGLEIERWLLAASLFGTRIAAATAVRTYRELAAAGVRTPADAGHRTWDELVELLDRGGYTRYDFRTATRLRALAAALDRRWPGGPAAMALLALRELERELDQLPGWGPVTVHLFLRELRGIWPATTGLPLDPRALDAARHLGLRPPGRGQAAWLRRRADRAGLDPRDLEGALVRAGLTHRSHAAGCPGGRGCTLLQPGGAGGPDRPAAGGPAPPAKPRSR